MIPPLTVFCPSFLPPLPSPLQVGQEVEVRPGIVSKTADGKIKCKPILSKIISLFAEQNQLQFAVPGGLIGQSTHTTCVPLPSPPLSSLPSPPLLSSSPTSPPFTPLSSPIVQHTPVLFLGLGLGLSTH